MTDKASWWVGLCSALKNMQNLDNQGMRLSRQFIMENSKKGEKRIAHAWPSRETASFSWRMVNKAGRRMDPGRGRL